MISTDEMQEKRLTERQCFLIDFVVGEFTRLVIAMSSENQIEQVRS